MMKTLKWYEKTGNDTDIVVSSRIRLARNLADYPFPNKMSLQQKFEVIQRVCDVIMAKDAPTANQFSFYDMDKMSHITAYSMVERHLISPEFAENPQGRAVLLSEDESVSIMINEEDHIRIQVLVAGLDFERAYAAAQLLDRQLEQHLKFAFDEDFGYLTECPTNLGTGMRSSAMLHIPALDHLGAVRQLAGTISKIGLTLRGTFGEGSEVDCEMYQLSNQITLGLSEATAIENLTGIVRQIIERERQARNTTDPDILEDAVYRSYGTLCYARSLTSAEFLNLISKLRLGVGMGIIKDITIEEVNHLIFNCQPASLQNLSGGALNDDTRDRLRAKTIRERLQAK